MSNIDNPNNYRGVTTQTDVTGVRSIGVAVFQNTLATPRFVCVTLECSAASPNAVYIYCDAAAAPSVTIARFYHNATVATIRTTLSFWVLPGYYYRAVLAQGAMGLMAWFEWN